MRLTLLISVWLLANPGLGQVHIYPAGLSDSTQSYLYIGVDNPIHIKGITGEYTISIAGGNGTIAKIDNDRYNVKVFSVTDHAIISISKQGPGKILASRVFKVRTIGEPRPNWISGSVVNRDTLLKNPFLAIIVPDCYYKLNFQIVSFHATIDHDGTIMTYPINGSPFSAEFIRHLETKKTGTLITFDNIRVIGPDGRSNKMPGIVLYLK